MRLYLTHFADALSRRWHQLATHKPNLDGVIDNDGSPLVGLGLGRAGNCFFFAGCGGPPEKPPAAAKNNANRLRQTSMPVAENSDRHGKSDAISKSSRPTEFHRRKRIRSPPRTISISAI